MSGKDVLRSADLHAMLSLINDAKDDAPGPALPWALLDGLPSLIRGVFVIGFNESVRQQRRMVIGQSVEAEQHSLAYDGIPQDSPWWIDSPCEQKHSSAAGTVSRWSANLDEMRTLVRTASYDLYWFHMKDMLSLGLPAPPGTRRSLSLFSTSGTFTDRDQAVLTLLAPHIAEIHRLGQARRAGSPQLTDREWEVLELAAEGLSNQQIARTLFTSVSTVRKHLEHIYDKSGARSRSAAVALMMPLHA